MKDKLFGKGLVMAIIVLFVGAGVVPSISGTIGDFNAVKSRGPTYTLNRSTLYVGDSDPGNYGGIQDPISSVMPDESDNEKSALMFGSENSNYTAIMFFMGRIDDLFIDEYQISFIAVNLWIIGYENDDGSTSFYILHTKSETKRFYISKDYDFKGILTIRFICGIYQIFQDAPSSISMNIFSKNDDANEVIWLVSGVEGNPIGINDVETILLNESGEPQPDAEITFSDNNADDLITPGDTFTVIAPSDGYYVFMLTHKISGATIYKSSSTHY